MRSTHVGGCSVARHRIGCAALLRPDGVEQEAEAFCLDDDGRLSVAVKVAPGTWVRETVEAGALVLERDEDAQALREAMADHAARGVETEAAP